MTTTEEASVRWPAEWEPHAATWLSWPHNPETWPGSLSQVEAVFVEMVRALAAGEHVHINVNDAAMAEHVEGCLRRGGFESTGRVVLHEIPTDDAWVRDHGAIFVARRTNGGGGGETLEALDFRFNAWGGKYPPWERDDAVAHAMAKALGLPHRRFPFVLEGGSIDGNGAGTLLTTERCLLHPNRNPTAAGMPPLKQDIEAMLREAFGSERFIWLLDGIEGDDTDGHIDDVARFVAPDRIVCVREDDGGNAHAPILAENWKRLRAARDSRGQAYDLVSLPMPPPIEYAGARLPASYANFYLANGVALVPTFDVPTDARALSILADGLPGREIVPIDGRTLVRGLGAVHCLTQQVPT